MISDGDRIKSLINGAKKEIILCSPFIKAKVLESILESAPTGIPVRIITRWRPSEVAAGLSDLTVFDIAKDRPNTELALLYHLHAKIYVADEKCLVGSANLTASALGWCSNPNLEILICSTNSNPDVKFLLSGLSMAKPATFQIRSEIENQIAKLSNLKLDEGIDVDPDFATQFTAPWLPRCATPDKIFDIYRDRSTSIVVDETRADAISDINVLLPAGGMNRKDFYSFVREALYQFPSFQQILNQIPAKLSDAEGEAIISDIRPELSQPDLQKQWQIVRDWIVTFFRSEFEMAPENYTLRLKTKI